MLCVEHDANTHLGLFQLWPQHLLHLLHPPARILHLELLLHQLLLHLWPAPDVTTRQPIWAMDTSHDRANTSHDRPKPSLNAPKPPCYLRRAHEPLQREHLLDASIEHSVASGLNRSLEQKFACTPNRYQSNDDETIRRIIEPLFALTSPVSTAHNSGPRPR